MLPTSLTLEVPSSLSTLQLQVPKTPSAPRPSRARSVIDLAAKVSTVVVSPKK